MKINILSLLNTQIKILVTNKSGKYFVNPNMFPRVYPIAVIN